MTSHDRPNEVLDGDADRWLEICLSELAESGPVDRPEDLAVIIDRLAANTDDDTRRCLLSEMIKLDMAMVAESGQVPRLERYLDHDQRGLSADSVMFDLVLEEIQLRKEAGEVPDPAEYQARFPHLETMLSHLDDSSGHSKAAGHQGPPPQMAEGQVIDDFEIVRCIGRGAFAQVYLAQQRSMQRLVALKTSHGGGEESQTLARMDHPHIVRIYDQRVIASPPRHLIYMQYHPGGTLADVIRLVRYERSRTNNLDGQILLDAVDQNLLDAKQAVPDQSSVRDQILQWTWPQVVAWMGMQLATALQHAHQDGVFHRDVKPANVLLTPDGIPKLADFNVSIHDAEQGDASQSLGGSIGYMSPEHLDAIGCPDAGSLRGDSGEVGIPADLYSLGVLLWELWQGRRPFECPAVSESTSKPCLSFDEAVQQQRNTRDKPLLETYPDDSPSARVLERALRQAIQPQPGERFASGAEMAGRLRLALHPDAATLFDPDERTLRSRLFRIPPWLLACAVLLIPHMIAGAINFQYNYWEVMPDDMMRSALARVSWWINLTFFPIALGFSIWYARRIVRAVATAKDNETVDREDITEVLALGHRGAVVGGILWMLSGITFPAIFWAMGLPLDTDRAIHFFASAVVCGGIAIIYPFFGMGLLASFVFYPRCLSRSIRDPDFETRRRISVCRGERYLILAAILPLLGAALMITSQEPSPLSQLSAITAGIVGLLAAAIAHRRNVQTWNELAEILASQRTLL